MNQELEANALLSHYRIVRKLGAGGMGEVYMAEDTRLRRKVALKVLPEKLANDAAGLLRFEREAFAASALNHPNILTVHEFGVDTGVHFLVTELVEGETLRQKIRDARPTPEEALKIAEQIAFALTAAHAAGIIHRDLKPENIMLRTDGIVKVVDFGLAKLTGPIIDSVDSEEKTLMQVSNQTRPGALMGTLRYMSPEQVRGQALDGRSDIFSFGIVLYEMLAGKDPFDKANSMDIFAAILTQEPLPIPQSPVELQRIVSKTLAKDRQDRYQTCTELLGDLKRLIKEMEFSLSRDRLTGQDHFRGTDGVEARTTNRVLARRFSLLHTLIILLLVSLALSLLWWFLLKDRASTPTLSPSALETVAVASWPSRPGEIYNTGSFSPDGKMIAFTSTQNGASAATKSGAKNIWITQVSGGEAFQVTKDNFTNQNPIWSPEGNEIAFYSTRGGHSGIWRMPAFGGTPTFLKTVSDGGMVLRYWSKKAIYYVADHNLFALDLKSGQAAQLTNLDANRVIANTIDISPNEQQIVYVAFENEQYGVCTMPVGGAIRQVARQTSEIRNTIWHTDNRRILYSALVAGVFQVFVTDVEGSQPRQLTFGDKDSLALEVSADGAKILYGSAKEESDVWGVKVENGEEFSFAADLNSELWPNVSPDSKTVAYQSINNLSQGDKIFSGAILTKLSDANARPFQLVANGFLPVWSPDGRQLAFMRVAGETYNLWTINASGGEEKQVTTEGLPSVEFSVLPYNRIHTSNFSWSPDSKTIAYLSGRSGQRNLWLADATNAGSRQLTDNTDPGVVVYCPLWSPDGKRLAYSANSSERSAGSQSSYTTSVLDLETGKTTTVLQSETFHRLLGWSQTGQEVICATLNAKTAVVSPAEIQIIQLDWQTGQRRQIAGLQDAYLYNLQLSLDRKLLAYACRKDDKDTLWVLRLSDGEVRKLTSNNDSRLYYSNLSWSPDGRTIYFGKQTRYSLLSMITNFR